MKNSLIISKQSDFIFMINSVLLLISLLISNYMFLTCVLLYFSVLLVYYSRQNLYVLFSTLMIAYSNWGIVVYRYWNPDMMPYNEISTTTGNIDVTGLRVTIFLVYIIMVITWKLKSPKMHKVLQESKRKTHNTFLVVVSCVALILIWVLYYDFSLGEKSGYSPQYEYSVVFFIMGLYYAGEKKILITPLLLIAAFYMVFDFIGGQRSTGTQIAIVVVLMVFYKYLNFRKIMVIALIGMVVLRAVASLRASLFTPDFTFQDIIAGMFETWFAPDTSGAAYYTSLVYIATMENYSFAVRLSQFGDFVASQFVVGTVGEALPYIALKHYWHGFGGILGIYMYYYLGFFGTALIGAVVAAYYRMMEKVKATINSGKSVYYIIAVYISATTIRWYNYSPSQLLRGVMLLLIVYFVFQFANRIFKAS